MKRMLIGLVLVLCSLALVSCSVTALFQEETPTPTPTSTKTPTPIPTATLTFTPTLTPLPPTETPTPTEDPNVEITFVNDTGEFVCAVFAYIFGESGEVENLLNDQVMMAGTSTRVELPKGEYTFEVWDCQMNKLHDLYGFVIEEDFEWKLSEVPEVYTYEGQQSLILVNERAWDVCELYIRPGDSEEWGDNLFHPDQGYYLPAGSTLIEPLETGVFDFMLVYCDGTVASTQMDLEIPEGQSLTWTLTP
jgi:hypothetical protein